MLNLELNRAKIYFWVYKLKHNRAKINFRVYKLKAQYGKNIFFGI